MSERQFYVIGGEYADTSFTNLAPGKDEERYGPFPESQALSVWRGMTGKTVDNALIRYRMRPAEAPPEETWHVVGGEYADTSFQKLTRGYKLQSFGPFARPEARAVWQAMSSKHVDNALVRFQIVSANRLGDFLGGQPHHERHIFMPTSMSAGEFRQWRQRMGFTAREAADALESSYHAVRHWERGDHPVPGPVRVACRLLEERRGV